MSSPEQPKSDRSRHLLDAIRAIRAEIGDALNDDEFTRFLQESKLPAEEGFVFLSYSNGYVTLSVPRQNPADWYLEQGWIASAKGKAAQAIAVKHGLSVFEPVDATWSIPSFPTNAAVGRHHLELTDRRQTVVVAHSQFLKVRLFGKSPDHRYAWQPLCSLALGPAFLQDLAILYDRKSVTAGESTSNPLPTTT